MNYYTPIDIATIHKLDITLVIDVVSSLGFPKRMSLDQAQQVAIRAIANACSDVREDEPSKTVVVPKWLNELAIFIYEKAYKEGYEARAIEKPPTPLKIIPYRLTASAGVFRK